MEKCRFESFQVFSCLKKKSALGFCRLLEDRSLKNWETQSSRIIHSLGGEYCWIVRDSEPIRFLKSPRYNNRKWRGGWGRFQLFHKRHVFYRVFQNYNNIWQLTFPILKFFYSDTAVWKMAVNFKLVSWISDQLDVFQRVDFRSHVSNLRSITKEKQEKI